MSVSCFGSAEFKNAIPTCEIGWVCKNHYDTSFEKGINETLWKMIPKFNLFSVQESKSTFLTTKLLIDPFHIRSAG